MSAEYFMRSSKSSDKCFSLTIEMLRKIVELKEREKAESEHISKLYRADSNVTTIAEALEQWQDEQAGIINRPAYKELESYLLSFSMENLVDLIMLMYLGRDRDCNMNMTPGKERFLEFCDRYVDIVYGKSKEELIDIVLEKTPLLMYLRTGYRLMNAPIGTSIDSISHNWNEM